MTALRNRSRTGIGARAALLPRPGDRGARGGADLRPQLAARRARAAAAGARRLHDRERRLAARARDPRRRWRAARLPQRLPPPRLAPAERLRRLRQGDPLPLPRLDLPPRRRADRRARGSLDPRPGQVRARPVPGPHRGDVRPRVREPRRRMPSRSPSRWPGCPSASSATSIEELRPEADLAGHAAGQLEDRGRELQRGLPHPDRASGADADARLQALRRGAARRLGLVRGAAAREALREPGRARIPAARLADARPARGGPARLALRVHLPEHHDRPLPRPGIDLVHRSGRPARHARRGGRLPRTRAPGCARGSLSTRTTG